MTEFRTIHRNGRTYKIPIKKSKNWIQSSMNPKHKGDARKYLKDVYGDEAFTERGTMKDEYIEKGIEHAKSEGNLKAERRLNEALTLHRINSNR